MTSVVRANERRMIRMAVVLRGAGGEAGRGCVLRIASCTSVLRLPTPRQANDDSGFIGAAIVGGFVILLAGWYGSRWVLRRVKEREVLSKPA